MTTTTANDTISVTALHEWAQGDLRMMAAVALLDDTEAIDHPWVLRFVKADPWIHIDFEAMRKQLRNAPLSGSERALVEAALSLCGRLDADLGSIAVALDRRRLDMLLDAIAIAGGKGHRL